MNEGYNKVDSLFSSGNGSNIFIKKKKLLDLSLCAGSLILGHNSKIFKNSMRNALKKTFLILLQKMNSQLIFQIH